MTNSEQRSVAQRWLDMYIGLLQGGSDVWSRLPNQEATKELSGEWSKIKKEGLNLPVVDLSAPLSARSRVLFIKSIKAYLSLKDGRFCTLMDCLEGPISRHPNPFHLRSLFASLEGNIDSKSKESDTSVEAELRAIAYNLAAKIEMSPAFHA